MEDAPPGESESAVPPEQDHVMEDLQRAVETPVPDGDDESLHVTGKTSGRRD